jgi:hypothetical protein
MRTYPARFVGEFARADFLESLHLPNIGDVAIVNGPWADFAPDSAIVDPVQQRIAIRCACHAVDEVALAPFVQRNGASWTLTSREPVNLEPSVITTIGNPDAGGARCHYFVHGGQLQMLDDTTTPLLT